MFEILIRKRLFSMTNLDFYSDNMKRICPFCETVSSTKKGSGYCTKCGQNMSIFYCSECNKNFYSCNHLHETYLRWDSLSIPRQSRVNRDSTKKSD